VLQVKKRTPTFRFSIVFTLESRLSLLKSLGVRQNYILNTYFQLNIDIEPNMTHNIIKILKNIYQTLHYNQMYNFALNHDHKI
jgi:hypothetical protein